MILRYGKPQARHYVMQLLDYVWGIFPAQASLFLIIALWQWVHNQMGAMIMPAPLAVFERIGEILSSVEYQEVFKTVWRGGLGVLLAVVTGSCLGFLAGISQTLALLLRPINTLLLGIPPIIWIVLAIFWFYMGDLSVIFTVWIVVLPLCFSAAQMSLRTVPNSLLEMVRVYKIPFSRQLTQLYIPHILRQMLPALIVAIGTGLKVTVMAELLGASDGMGSKIGDARAMLETTDVMAYVSLILLISMGIEYGILEPIRRYFIQGESYAKT
ncbi:ABC transporter permease subunit [Pasteurellaceae bacterium LIM206]|nr:ABC transporter permease subunit [Pasteurellaceae bacterium LIM206]